MPKAATKPNFKSTRKFWKLFIILSLLDIGDGINSKKEVIVEAGENVTVHCNVTFETVSVRRRDIVNILWMWKPKNETKWKPLNKTNNEGFLQANEGKQETRTNYVISALELLDLTISDSGTYGCFIVESNAPLDETKVEVGYSPDAPIQLSCELNGKLTSLKCSWSPGKETYLPTNYYVNHSIETGHEFQNQSWPAFRDHVFLNVANSYTFLHLVRVEAVNYLNSIASRTIELVPSNHIKTQPPISLLVEDNDDATSPSSSSLLVTWASPEVNVFVCLLYCVRYRQNNWNTEWINASATRKLSYIVTNLSPYTTYDIQVATRPDPDESFVDGSWSEWSQIETFRTALKAPSQHFVFNKITATMTSQGVPPSWKIEASWHLYTDPHQPGFFYEISYDLSSEKKKHQLQQNNIAIVIETDQNLLIAGKFCNDVGCSSNKQEVVLITEAPSPVENVAVALEANQAITNWDIRSNLSSHDSCQIHLCSFERATKRALFSIEKDAEDDEYLCQQEVADITVPCSDSQATVVLSSSPCREYYAIVRRLLKTGIQDLITSSKPSLSQTINPPKMSVASFSASDQSDADNYAIQAEWQPIKPLCMELHKDTVVSVLYTPISGSECQEAKDCNLKNPFHVRLNNCSATSYDLTSNIYGSTRYNVSLGRCCKSAADESDVVCFSDRAITDFVETPVGAPTIPLSLQWAAGNPLTLSWLPPKHKNGNIDGYVVSYYRINDDSSTENSEEFKEIITFSPSVELQISCPTAYDNSSFVIRLKAYNLKNGKKLFGPTLEQRAPLCDFVNSNSPFVPTPAVNAIALIAGLASTLFLVLFILGLSLYHRRRLKRSVRKYLWPSIPDPLIMVPMSNVIDGKGKRYKDIYDDAESYCNSAYSSSRTVFHGDVNDNQSCVEIADNIREYSRHKSINGNNLTEEKSTRSSCFDQQDQDTKQAVIQSNDDVDKNVFQPEQVTCEVFSHFSPATPASSFPPTTEKDLLLTPDSTRSTATWCSLLYPNCATSGGASSGTRRPHSIAGSSGSSFLTANYVKDFVGLRKLVNWEEEKNVNQSSESRLEPLDFNVESHQPPMKLNRREKFRQCRGMSWYEGCSTINAPDNQSLDSACEVDSCRAYYSSTSPYVTLPYVMNESYLIEGTTKGCTTDDYCESEFISGGNIDEDDPGEATQRFKSFQSKTLPQLSNFAVDRNKHSSSSGVSDCNSPEYLSDLPLLECYSPSSPKYGNSYVSMSDALSSSEQFRINPNYQKSEKDKTRILVCKFDFDERYVASALSNAGSYVRENEPLSSTSPVLNPPKSRLTDVASYVTTTDTAFAGS